MAEFLHFKSFSQYIFNLTASEAYEDFSNKNMANTKPLTSRKAKRYN